VSRQVRVRSVDPSTLPMEQIYRARAFIGVSSTPPPGMAGLRKLVAWADQRFPDTQLVLGDHLDQYNIASEHVSLRQAEKQAIAQSARLRAAIASMLAEVAPRCHMTSSAELRQRKEFSSTLAKVSAHFDQHEEFRQAVLKDVEAFELRQARRGEPASTVRHKYHIDYVLEELAMFAVMVEDGYPIHLYAGTHLTVLRAMANRCLAAPVPALAAQVCVELSVSGMKEDQ
jgi:tRNA-dependent cyclodipeptide synthase